MLGSNQIWEINDLDPNLTTILNTTASNLKELSQFKKLCVEIESSTKCSITVHGLETNLIWIRIKHQSGDKRKVAQTLINTLTHKPCDEIRLPNLTETTNRRYSSTDYLNKYKPKQSLKDETKNEKEYEIASPFGSILSPLKIGSNEEQIRAKSTTRVSNGDENESKVDQKRAKNRYEKDFLLFRADVDASKKMPENWTELNEKYPEICFSGKVLAYFNPHKYHGFWNKVRELNSMIYKKYYEENHRNHESPSNNSQRKNHSRTGFRPPFDASLNKTDDFIDFKHKPTVYKGNFLSKYAPKQSPRASNETENNNENQFKKYRSFGQPKTDSFYNSTASGASTKRAFSFNGGQQQPKGFNSPFKV